MNRALRSVEEKLYPQLEKHGLSLTEFAVLEVLLNKGALPIGDVGERVLRSSGSMTYVIDKLEQRGYLRRRRCEEDRRVLYVELTPKGERRIKPVFAEHAEFLRLLLRGLTHEERLTAARLLKKMGLYAAEASEAAP